MPRKCKLIHTSHTKKACFLLFANFSHAHNRIESLLVWFEEISLQIVFDGRHFRATTTCAQVSGLTLIKFERDCKLPVYKFYTDF